MTCPAVSPGVCRKYILIILASFLGCALLLAQGNQGSIRGVLTDTTGGVLPGVSVTVTSEETGLERSVVTNDQGIYLLAQVKPGRYVLSAEMAGFKTVVQRGITVHVNENVVVDLVMEIGELTEQVEVTGEAILKLDTTTASVGTLVDPKTVVELPLNGRHYTQLILLTSGASDRDRDQSQGAVGGTNAMSLAVNGQRSRANRYTLNGIYNEELMRQTPGLAPPIDAIREFTVETHSNSAAADAPGAAVNVELRSGTNEFHGSVWEFHRNDNLDANFFFANRAGQEKPEFLQNQFGFILGGPIVKNHSFFLGSYEGFRQRKGLARLATVPTAAVRSGDFSGFETIFDPLTTRTDPGGSGLIRDPFPNNRIPEDRINAASQLILDSFYPLPNLSGTNRNLINAQPNVNNRDQFMLRFDTGLTQNTQLWVHYGFSDIDQVDPSSLTTVHNLLTFRFQNTGVNLVHTFSPNSILSGRVGYARVETTDTPVKPISRQEFFERGGITFFQTDVARDSFVGASIQGFTGPGGGSSDRNRVDNTYQGAGSYEHIRGNHKLSLGADIRQYQFLIDPPNPQNGTISFDALLTQDPQNPAGTGNGFATFLLGFPSQISRGFGDSRTDGRQWALHLYLQDEWRVTPKLTLNLGLRYQYDSAATDVQDRLGTMEFVPIQGAGAPFEPGSMMVNLLWASTNPFTGEPANARRSIIDPEYNDVAPRIGLAYKLNDTTVFRAGFGVFYDSLRFQELQDMRKHFPFNAQQRLSVNSEGIPDVSWQSSVPFDPVGTIGGWPQNKRNRHGYSQQWNLSVQRQLMRDILLEVGYLGSHNLKQIRYYSFNDPRPGPGDPNLRRPALTIGSTEIGNNDTNANYNALQFKLNKRFSQGLSFLSMYTYSHTIDDQSSLAVNQIQDGFDTRASRSAAHYDLRHNFVTSYIYELPIGPGRGWDVSGWKNQLIGQWQIQGILRAASGPPQYIGLPTDHANIGSFRRTQRPNLVGAPNSGPQTVDEWFNTSAFELPAPFTFGNAGRNIVRADGRFNMDFSLFKSFQLPPLGEQGRLEFRAEFFNIFNHQDFDLPNGSFGTSSFGTISGATEPRDIQFALKLYF